MTNFRVGQEVVFVGPLVGPNPFNDPVPDIGEVLTIKEIFVAIRDDWVWLRFEEHAPNLAPRHRGIVEEQAYSAEAFRPVQKKHLPESLTRLLDQPHDKEVETV